MRKKLFTGKRGRTQIFAASNRAPGITNSKLKIANYVFYLCLFVFICGLFFFYFKNSNAAKVSAENPQSEIEKAIFTRQEFFGVEAIVPLPTNEAREALAKLAETQPDNLQILEKLAEFDEKLERFDEAEKALIRLSESDFSKNEMLAAFYHRRANFQKEAAVLKKLLFAKATKNRTAIFEKLIDLARIHDLQEYLQPKFYEEITKENPNSFGIFQKLSEKLIEEKNYREALKFIRQAKIQFPERRDVLLDKEIEILLEMKTPEEAEKVYRAAFDPFWSNEEAEKFYNFLSNQDHLSEYGAELKAKFKKNPADFETGVRLAHYQKHDYDYGNEDIAPIILKIESVKKDWTTDELVTATRFLLQEGNGSLASRFLYTLYLREDFQKNSAQRAKILYQLFKVFSDAEYQKLPLTKGDFRFYEDVAKADMNPGIATGILSLIFSDTNPQAKLEAQENQANGFFNRAAAYRIFEEYKKESPLSTELAQMYLDIVRIYAAAKETEIAEKTLNEFTLKFKTSKDYPAAATKLAEAFSAVKQEGKARETYQKLLDYLGKKGKPLSSQKTESENNSSSEESEDSESEEEDDETKTNSSGSSDESTKQEVVFYDYLNQKPARITYQEVLAKIVSSLLAEKKTAEILALYSNEIAKYPAEEWLYEARLTWLEQTNLTEEKLEFYKLALARFKTNNWRDKLARFFVREKRTAEFTKLSEDLVGKLNDKEIQEYLEQFIDGNISAKDFNRKLYFKLYQSAHQRFPHNVKFVNGLLNYYKTNKQEADWRKLSAEYYFESKEIRENFLNNLAEKAELRNHLQNAKNKENTIYELFRADASAHLSDYENSVAAYRKLNQLYPHTPEFYERLIAFTRSFGQKDRAILAEASEISKSQADYILSSAEYRTRSGEIFAELGDYKKSREEWEKIIATARGTREIYLDTATLYWDYFQFDDALRTIKNLRQKFQNETLYAYESAAILESQNKQSEAIGEYVKALDANQDDEQKEKSQKRLTRLLASENSAAKKQEISQIIHSAFLNESTKRKDSSFLALGYAEFLTRNKQTKEAQNILNLAVERSANIEFLEDSRDFYQTEGNQSGEQLVLKKLAEISKTPRQKIKFELQLAESYRESKNRDAAKIVLDNLVQKFPLNYGVLIESVNFYKRLGFESQAVSLLKNTLPQSRGEYRTSLTQKLAKLLIQTNQLDAAEQILIELHDQDKANIEIFRELANVCVRTGKADLLRRSFDETVKALKESKTPRYELDNQIAELRISMIDAFTRLQDYRSAIAQHIEIINREPENERLTENAIRYVQRYGGADVLLNYYQKLSLESFKNYRWNVVLARIYQANNDTENALKNYRAAIANQPEKVELYLAIAEIETKRKNFDAALKNFDTILELTNDNAVYVKKKIEVLKQAGRTAEIAVEKAKLSAESEKKIAENEFSEAKKLASAEKTKAREIYRQAFAKLLENPLLENLNAADISGYVQSVREEESLDLINKRLWDLREKLVGIADKIDSTDAGEARKRLSILDGAMIESIGNIAKTVGTDAEISALHEDLKNRIESLSSEEANHRALSLAQNIGVRAGFGDLEERILQRKLEANRLSSDKKIHLQNLMNFYNERGAYQKTFDVLEKYGSDDLPLRAETARLVGDQAKELEILRTIYQQSSDKLITTNDANVARFLEILYSQNREELKSLTEKNSVFQLQLINFLLAKGERALAHRAIQSSNLPTAWKVSRQAETSLALKEFGETSECFFCEALQLTSIGEMTKQLPDKKRFLINDDWFRLTREYGEWLYEKKEKGISPSKFLTAMTESLPNDPQQQVKLGVFYLQKKEYEKAIEHFRLADESYAYNEELKTYLGAANYLAGRKTEAEKIWSEIFQNQQQGEEIKSSLAFLEILQEYDLANQMRGKLPPIIIKFLEENNAENSEDFQKLIRAVSTSFTDESAKSAYFKQILQKRPIDKSLAKMLIEEDLIAKSLQNDFYKLIIERSEKSLDYDYIFQSVQQRVFDNTEAEYIYEQENDYKTEESKDDRLTWQRNYLKYLLEQRKNAEAANLIAEIEAEIKNRYALPLWLRASKIQLQIRVGNYDSAEAEKVIGITVPESATETKPPSLERFNEILRVLKAEKRNAEAAKLSEDFFSRNLALEQFETANFAGLARLYFQRNETQKGLEILRLMIETHDESSRETALAEIFSLENIKTKLPNATKTTQIAQKDGFSQTDALKVAAEIAAEFKQNDSTIVFRKDLLNLNSGDSSNKIELAKLLSANDQKDEAIKILNEVINDRNSLRSARWQAKMSVREMGENIELPQISFDAFSQFYNGMANMKSNQIEIAKNFFVTSLIADKDPQVPARAELIKAYKLSGKSYAALKTVGNYRETKSDDLLQILSEAAEQIEDFQQAIEFERAKSNSGNDERITNLKKLLDAKNKRATDFTVDTENTRKI